VSREVSGTKPVGNKRKKHFDSGSRYRAHAFIPESGGAHHEWKWSGVSRIDKKLNSGCPLSIAVLIGDQKEERTRHLTMGRREDRTKSLRT
jgi:hypothetical protein